MTALSMSTHILSKWNVKCSFSFIKWQIIICYDQFYEHKVASNQYPEIDNEYQNFDIENSIYYYFIKYQKLRAWIIAIWQIYRGPPIERQIISWSWPIWNANVLTKIDLIDLNLVSARNVSRLSSTISANIWNKIHIWVPIGNRD